jgi:YbbR domain-containing protein
VVYVVSQGAVSGQAQRVVTGVPVEVVGLPSGLVVTDLKQSTVAVTVTGPQQIINHLDTTAVTASVNLDGTVAGDHAYRVAVSVPAGVQWLATTPPDVDAVTEPLVPVEFAVQVDTSGAPAAGFGLDKTRPPTVQPTTVVVSGPQSAMENVVRVAVNVPVVSARSDVSVQATAVPEDSNNRPVQNVTVSPSTVQVTVPIAPVVPQKQVPVQAQISGAVAAGDTVTGVVVDPPTVTLLGPQSSLDALATATTEPVSVAGATGTVRTTAAVIQPPGVTAVNPTEVTVTVTIGRTH